MKLNLVRPRQWRDGWRTYVVKADGTEIGRIRAGQTVVVEVSDGARELTAHIDWCSGRLDLAGVEAGATVFISNALSDTPRWKRLYIITPLLSPREWIKIRVN